MNKITIPVKVNKDDNTLTHALTNEEIVKHVQDKWFDDCTIEITVQFLCPIVRLGIYKTGMIIGKTYRSSISVEVVELKDSQDELKILKEKLSTESLADIIERNRECLPFIDSSEIYEIAEMLNKELQYNKGRIID